MNASEGMRGMKTGKSLVGKKEVSDHEALHELMEILKEPFMSNCDKCAGTGLRQSRTCQICDGKGFIRIDFV